MTEKRLIVRDGDYAWVDTVTDTVIDVEDAFDLVNRLHEENKQLKQSHTKLKHRHSLLHDECLDAECDRDSYQKDISSLEKENNQLKQENNDLVKLINDLGSGEMDRQMEEILND